VAESRGSEMNTIVLIVGAALVGLFFIVVAWKMLKASIMLTLLGAALLAVAGYFVLGGGNMGGKMRGFLRSVGAPGSSPPPRREATSRPLATPHGPTPSPSTQRTVTATRPGPERRSAPSLAEQRAYLRRQLGSADDPEVKLQQELRECQVFHHGRRRNDAMYDFCVRSAVKKARGPAAARAYRY